MSRLEKMRDHLPSLYRPDHPDESLLSLFLRAIADALDKIDTESTNVMQSRWFEYSDNALYSPYFILSRQRSAPSQPLPKPNDKVLNSFTYIQDLARLASLLPLQPWTEQQELVEAFRKRIRDVIALYEEGLGTIPALRRIVEAQLPRDVQALSQQKDRPFDIEERVPFIQQTLAAPTRGRPFDMVGPLMQWEVINEGVEAASPTLYVQGVQPRPDSVDATVNPVIELYAAAERPLRLGIAYKGSLDSTQTLRLRPAFSSWLGRANGISKSLSAPDETRPADPTAPGPWESVDKATAGTVTAIHQTTSRMLWVAANEGGSGQLLCFDGNQWKQFIIGAPPINCLDHDRDSLFIGHAEGLWQMNLNVDPPSPLPPKPKLDGKLLSEVAGLTGRPVNAIYHTRDGKWLIGSDDGALVFTRSSTKGVSDSVVGSGLTAMAVNAITQDRSGILYFGTSLGLLQFRPDGDSYYWYEGKELSELAPDWQYFTLGPGDKQHNLPKDNTVFLPAVKSVHRGPDGSLWIGTEKGIARYIARSVRGLSYETVLQGFPDLMSGPVFDIKEDARGCVWFCTAKGLFRHDGRDFWQLQSNKWQHLGRADFVYSAKADPVRRGAYRFLRSASQWQIYDSRLSIWTSAAVAPLTTEEPAVRCVTWTDEVRGEIGKWDGHNFTGPARVADGSLSMRYKPSETRIVVGGIPAAPHLPVGSSIWRYLSLEPEGMKDPAPPAWTTEGRQIQPPDVPAPGEGRYDVSVPPPPSDFDQSVFAFNPSAKVWFSWEPKQALSILVRLKTLSDEKIDPAVIDRVWQGIQQVRPAGSRALLAVDDIIMRGK